MVEVLKTFTILCDFFGIDFEALVIAQFVVACFIETLCYSKAMTL